MLCLPPPPTGSGLGRVSQAQRHKSRVCSVAAPRCPWRPWYPTRPGCHPASGRGCRQRRGVSAWACALADAQVGPCLRVCVHCLHTRGSERACLPVFTYVPVYVHVHVCWNKRVRVWSEAVAAGGRTPGREDPAARLPLPLSDLWPTHLPSRSRGSPGAGAARSLRPAAPQLSELSAWRSGRHGRGSPHAASRSANRGWQRDLRCRRGTRWPQPRAWWGKEAAVRPTTGASQGQHCPPHSPPSE